ncbi:MAG TPA: hemerythrin domain-containing protein [Polyangiaceae bacterium]|nr:hemerythrin domain-containing protein [Polyangiaceae bacterium]
MQRWAAMTAMNALALPELLRCRHRSLGARIAALEVDGRVRRVRVVQLAEELVAHATVEQLVFYPYAEQLLGLKDLATEIERALDALLGVVGGIDDDPQFFVSLARLSAAFQQHVEGDEAGLMPMVEALGDPDDLARMAATMQEFERALAGSRDRPPYFWPEPAVGSSLRGGNRN